MSRIQVVTDAMHIEADKFSLYADELLTSQQNISKLIGNMGHDFSGKLPSLITQSILALDPKYELINEILKVYSGFIHHAADIYDANDAQMAAMATALGVGGGVVGGSGSTTPGGWTGNSTNPVTPGDEIKVGYQIPRDSEYYNNNPFSRGQCTWYAFGRSQELTGKQVQWGQTSGRHGGLWPEKASNLEAISGVPSAGSIMTWTPGMGGTYKPYGHVAVVEKVEPIYENGQIVDYNVLYSQANWGDNNAYGENPETDGVVIAKKLSEFAQNGITAWNIA